MFKYHQLLSQLKQTLQAQTPRVEGIVKSTDKGFGFLEVDGTKTYFIPPQQMNKLMHGDRIIATISTHKNRELVEPEQLVKPFLTRFIGRIKKKHDNLLYVQPDQYFLKNSIVCYPALNISHDLFHNDWVIAEITSHPLKNKGCFQANITKYITHGDDQLAPWLVTLSWYKLDIDAPQIHSFPIEEQNIKREDLTHLHFITIDSASTEDMDDALYIERTDDETLRLFVAIADPTSYIPANSELDTIAQKRGYTHYLPGLNIPMLPRELSDNLCSLRPHERRPALVCQLEIKQDGQLENNINFSLAWIESKKKLVYNDVSDWLEQQQHKWQPENPVIKNQILLLHEMCNKRLSWRLSHALVLKARPNYRFVLDKNGNVLEILAEQRRIANNIIEEAMIAANLCATKVLKEKLGFGIFNVHHGFDHSKIDNVLAILQESNIENNAETLLSLKGFGNLQRLLNQQPTQFIESRIRRFQSCSEIKNTPAAHYGLGFDAYATWTSPIRKYTDIINHRLLKALINHDTHQISKPSELLTAQITERKRALVLAERDVGNWLYARFLKKFTKTNMIFAAEITDITRGGIRIRLIDNGANAFIPAPLIHPVREEIQCSKKTGTIIILGHYIYKLNDVININIVEVKMETRHIIAKLIV